MTNKNTRNALFMSVVAMILCFTMLLGTTFAWFTDSVSSARNTIVSGNLDVELYYSKLDANGNWTEYAEVDENTKVFDDNALYEPGYTEVVKFKVVNAGSLAFKYNLDVAVNSETKGTNKANTEFALSDYLYVAAIDDVASVTSRDVAAKAADKALKNGFAIRTNEEFKANTADQEFVLVLTMPTTVGNEANHLKGKQPSIELGIDLFATQKDYEKDSFGDDYDIGADYDGSISSIDSLIAAFKNGGTYKLTDSIIVPAGTLPTVTLGTTVVLDLNGNAITAENSATEYAFNNLGNLTIYDSKAASTYSLRAAAITGSINARGIYNGYDADGNYVTTAKLTIKSGTFNAMGTDGGAAVFNYGTANIQGGVFTVTGAYALNNRDGATMNIDGAVLSGGIYNLGDLTIEDAAICNELSGKHTVYHAGTKLVINGGTFENYSNNAIIRSDSSNVTINGGTFTMGVDSYILGGNGIAVNGGVFNGFEKADGTVVGLRPNDGITVSGGTFSFDPSAYLADGLQSVAAGENYAILPAGYAAVAGVDGLYNNGVEYIVVTADGFAGLNAMMADKTAGKNIKIALYADIDMAGKTWTPVDSHADTAFAFSELNGNGYTIYNLTINGQAMFKRFAGSGDVTVKDVTFDNATVNSTSINSSILTVQSYQNVTLDNVDVVNSSITGAYKVAPLIATVYNEKESTVTATLKNCDVSNTTVTATSYDFCTTGMVAFVYADDNDKIVFENCTVSDVMICAPDDSYKAHAAIYTTGSGSLYNEADGVTVTNVTFIAK